MSQAWVRMMGKSWKWHWHCRWDQKAHQAAEARVADPVWGWCWEREVGWELEMNQRAG